MRHRKKSGQQKRFVTMSSFMKDNTSKTRGRLHTIPYFLKPPNPPIFPKTQEPVARLLIEHAHCRCMFAIIPRNFFFAKLSHERFAPSPETVSPSLYLKSAIPKKRA